MQIRHTRRRPTKSCLECNRRKQKCNREKPCNQCIARDVEHLCNYRELGPRPRASRAQLQERENARGSWTSAADTDDSGDVNESNLEALEALGYGADAPSGLLRDVLQSTLVHPPRSPNSTSLEISDLPWNRDTSQAEAILTPPNTTLPVIPAHLRARFPSRPVADFLIDMFIREINRIYELIHPSSFMPRYNSWWKDFTSSCDVDDESMDFGLLILRLCVLSLQCLPHPNYPTVGLLNVHPRALKRQLYTLANSLEQPQYLARNRKRSLASIQHQYYHICYLKNNAQIRECWFLLSQTVNDAHAIGIHLEKPVDPVDGLEMELRRRTFWSLYIWDKFMCTFLGRWPLIPEGHYDVDLPRDNLQAIITSPYHLTPFTDRLCHIKLAQFMQHSMSSFSWKKDQHNPHVIAQLAQRLDEDIISHLPPAYRLIGPDTSWDVAEPSIPEKRQGLYLVLYATKAGLYRAYIDPWNALSQNKDTASTEPLTPEALQLSLTHYRILVDSACLAISTITAMYHMSGGNECHATERFFMLPVSLMETLACLGLCLLSAQLAGAKDVLDTTTTRSVYKTFFDAFDLLTRQAQASTLARRGIKILDSLHNTLLKASPASPLSDENAVATGFSSIAISTPGSGVDSKTSSMGDGDSLLLFGDGGSIELPDWMPSFMESPDSSWFFNESLGREVTSMDMYYNSEALTTQL